MKRWIIIAAAFLFAFTPFFEQEAQASSISDQVISTGKSQVGAPYQWGGTTPSGFDCSGFTGYVFNKAGISLPRTAAQQFGAGDYVSKSNLRPGDLVFFSETRSVGNITHNGIYIGNGDMVHASGSRGVEIRSISSFYWDPRYVGARRVISENEQVDSSGNEVIPVTINGKTLQTDQDPFLQNDTTMVPLRAIFEELGADVEWNNSLRQAEATLGSKSVKVAINDRTGYASGSRFSLEEPAMIRGDRTMVPLRFVSESLGADVNWNRSARTVTINQ
ncbi:stalk domain-containing protein [Alkalicoccus halolimnae]|uniref:NlpC/P60 family protein n=1 Tax=Alkalicoccus halolimnae TaxID=1667239 RepID=A0A5C7FL28_9BACI|nr:NlpC/P60 family protein [Alkalicoccus halolimnae]TXF86086.1 hypothetical protein FTX54_05570 [Alkalicoccus halolimnae]